MAPNLCEFLLGLAHKIGEGNDDGLDHLTELSNREILISTDDRVSEKPIAVYPHDEDETGTCPIADALFRIERHPTMCIRLFRSTYHSSIFAVSSLTSQVQSRHRLLAKLLLGAHDLGLGEPHMTTLSTDADLRVALRLGDLRDATMDEVDEFVALDEFGPRERRNADGPRTTHGTAIKGVYLNVFPLRNRHEPAEGG